VYLPSKRSPLVQVPFGTIVNPFTIESSSSIVKLKDAGGFTPDWLTNVFVTLILPVASSFSTSTSYTPSASDHIYILICHCDKTIRSGCLPDIVFTIRNIFPGYASVT